LPQTRPRRSTACTATSSRPTAATSAGPAPASAGNHRQGHKTIAIRQHLGGNGEPRTPVPDGPGCTSPTPGDTSRTPGRH
jgi:hypothetical protein